jgi:polyferredoxin
MLWIILLIYIVVGWFFPIVSWVALVCMVGPVLMATFRGRYWCGNICPRGNFYSNVIARISRNKRIPNWLRSNGFRTFMLAFIMLMFAVQFYFSWGDWAAMGSVFWRLIVATTIVGIVLGVIYSPRAWCTFCPMGTLSKMVTNNSKRAAKWRIEVSSTCRSCTLCSRKCPMQLDPHTAKGKVAGYDNPDCLRCNLCTTACPINAIKSKKENNND